MVKSVAFIGLGNMGTPISRHLLQAGFNVSGYDVVKEKITGLEPDGLRGATSPADAAKDAEAVFTMLMRPEIINDVLYGEQGIVHGAKPGTILVDMSTMSPAFQRERFEEIARRGFRPFEAPVSGSVPHAEAKQLTIMAGGEEAIFQELKPVFEAFGKNICYMGEAGKGTLMKLLTNLILAVNLAGLLEGLILGQKGGLKVDQMLDILVTGAAFSRVMEFKNELLKTRDYVGKLQGSTELFTKDVRCALDELGAPIPHGALVLQDLISSNAHGNTQKDYSALLDLLESRAGL
jgi:3-hydroxyisobutyrate dehydrogenase-like beta-hydroxyacid dehydrogenase